MVGTFLCIPLGASSLDPVTTVIFCGNPLRGNLWTIADVVLFCGTAVDATSFFHGTFPPNFGCVLDDS